MTQQSQELTDWGNCVRRKVCYLKIHVKFTYWSQCIATTPKARLPDDPERGVSPCMIGCANADLLQTRSNGIYWTSLYARVYRCTPPTVHAAR